MNRKPKLHLPRVCIEANGEAGRLDPLLLSQFRARSAYVLLGNPGMGKTDSFKYEAGQTGNKYIRARDFIHDVHDDLTKKVLFIDGLDEVRSSSADGIIPLDQIRKKLIGLGKPDFRLSCREADWFGSSDEIDLAQITRDYSISVLHLQPLDQEGIQKILAHHFPNLDRTRFIDWMSNKSLEGLLSNPQLLILFGQTWSGDIRPTSRKEAYELACQKMVEETNTEHQRSGANIDITTNGMLDAVGKLCAHQLLADLEGYATSHNSIDDTHPIYKAVPHNPPNLLLITLKSKLFKSGSSDEQREPVHRSISEYLAARYISNLVDQKGLPVGRVLSLMTSSGSVVTPLRGLYAWLAVICNSERDSLLRRDPLGIILYGDPRHLHKDQKIILLEGLHQEAESNPRFRNENWTDSPFGALSTNDMVEVFRRILTSESRTNSHQSLVDCILDAMLNGDVLPSLKDSLLEIVKDTSRFPSIRKVALKTLLRDKENKFVWLSLFNQIQSGEVEDRTQDLEGELLYILYPEIITPNVIFDYMHSLKDDHYIGRYHDFWVHELAQTTHGDNLKILIDELGMRYELRKQLANDYSFRQLVGNLLIPALEKYGDSISIERLYTWLGIGVEEYAHHLERAEQITIEKWFEKRPDKYKQILLEGARRCAGETDDKFEFCMYEVESHLYQSPRPKDYTDWLLRQAESSKGENLTHYCFNQAVRSFYGEDKPDISLEQLELWVDRHPDFLDQYREMTIMPIDDKCYERAEKKSIRKNEDKQRRLEWLRELVGLKEQISTGEAYPNIYYDLGRAYSGHLHEARGDTPSERLATLFEDYPDMVLATLTGLSNVIHRKDLPSPSEIIELYIKEGKLFYIEFGVLAGMRHTLASTPEVLGTLSKLQIQTAATFFLIHGTGNHGEWFDYLLKTQADLISEVYIKYATAILKARKAHIYGSYALAFDEKWQEIAKNSAVEILKKYPVRSRLDQISELDNFLKSALRYYPNEIVFELVQHKLGLKSMDIPQHCRWLAVALLMYPEEFEQQVFEYIKNSSKRALLLVAFYIEHHEQWKLNFNLPASTLVMLIAEAGIHAKPYQFNNSGWVAAEINTADLVQHFISMLGKKIEQETINLLESLIEDGRLEEWHLMLKDQLYSARKRISDQAFIKPTLSNVTHTLRNKEPSNPSDLMYMAMDILDEQANKIRNDNLNIFRQFWDFQEKDNPPKPKSENDCRDILISLVGERFTRLSIQLDKERYFVEDNRADIAICYDSFHVPVEIKKDCYKKGRNNVWNSLWSQLINKYTRDTGANGYGIYLVLWFGQGDVPRPPDGMKPTSAKEMKSLLWSMMDKEEKRQIGLCMIDCSLPR